MTTTHASEGAARTPLRRAHLAGHDVLLLPLVIPLALVLAAVGYISYVLWPRWPGPPVAADTPALPITIAGVGFNVPPAAIRVPVQRRPGAQERVDLAFLWPSLEPPPAKAAARTPAAAASPSGILDRMFVTIAGAGDTLPPSERVKTIYPRYATTEPVAGPAGLAVLAFRDGTPYQGEDLVYDAEQPDGFLARCSRDSARGTPGTCLHQRRIGSADIVVRFPRDWLDDWRAVADAIDRLIGRLRPPGSFG